MANGNVAVSIVDFLKARGLRPQAGEKFPFFETRGQLFGRLGLSSNLGEFRGTAEQNIALLQSLRGAEKTTGISITPENIFDVAMVSMGGGTQAPAPIQPTPMEQPTQQAPTAQAPTQAQLPTQQTQPVQQTAPIPGGTPQDVIQGTTPLAGDVSTLLPQVPEAGDVTQMALERVQRGATFPLQQEAVEAQKETIRLGSQRQKESFIQQIASRGLFFSGAKVKGLQTIEADQLSQILGVDRSFALLIAQGLERATQDIVKEAQKGRQEAIQSLQTLGFAINPVTGRIEPTLAARGKAEQARQFEVAEVRREEATAEQVRQFEVREERLRIQQDLRIAQEEFDRAVTLDQRRVAQENLEIAQAKEARLTKEEAEAKLFTQTQTNKGAVTAGMSINDFQTLDVDTQNFFINNSSEINRRKTSIDDAKIAKEDPTEIEREISEGNAPDAVKDALIRHLWTVFPRPKPDVKQWWEFWKQTPTAPPLTQVPGFQPPPGSITTIR